MGRSIVIRIIALVARTAIFLLIVSPVVSELAQAQIQAPQVFGFTPVPVPPQSDLTPYTKWRDMERRMQENPDWADEDCTSAVKTCPQREWRKMLGRARSRSEEEQLDDVNRFLNKIDYVPDAINWNGIDYWETPREFFLKGGECKDYSISKYFSLKILGWPAERLWIVILQDLNLRVTHAVLAAELPDKTLILDNQVADLVDQSRIHHYRPIFALSEAGWVIYRPLAP